jgi:hypothetical protein
MADQFNDNDTFFMVNPADDTIIACSQFIIARHSPFSATCFILSAFASSRANRLSMSSLVLSWRRAKSSLARAESSTVYGLSVLI